MSDKKDWTYGQLCHAMQSGVAAEQGMDPKSGEPKHLRVGLNSCQVNDAALARLLIEKGIISANEYEDAVRDEMLREVERHEARLSRLTGKEIKLV